MREKLYIIEIVPRRRWWVTPYIHLLAGLCALMGAGPNCDKTGKFIARWGFKYESKLKEVK